MKRIFLFCTLAALIAACNNQLEVNIEQVINTLSVDQSTFTFGANEVTTRTATVTTDAASWNATAVETWLTVAKQGNFLQLTSTANTGSAQRSATVTVTAGNAVPVSITVTQAGIAITLSVDPTTISFTASETATKTATVNTNAASWDATTSDPWLTVGKQGNMLQVTPKDQNTGTAERKATVKVTAGNASPVDVEVTQAGKPVTVYNTAKGRYLGDYWNNGRASFTIDLYNSSNPKVGFYLQGFCTLPSKAADFKLDVGTYSIASTGALRTIHPGSVKDDVIYPSCLYDENMYIYTLITGGTLTVALTGNTYTITADLSGRDSKTGATVNNILISYTGQIVFEDETKVRFEDIVKSTYNATGTPRWTNPLGPATWSGNLEPEATPKRYKITNWGNRGVDYYVYCKYTDEGKIIMDTETRVAYNNTTGRDGYFRVGFFDNNEEFRVFDKTFLEVDYNLTNRILNFSGTVTYQGSEYPAIVGIAAYDRTTGDFVGWFGQFYEGLKLQLTPIQSTSSKALQESQNVQLNCNVSPSSTSVKKLNNIVVDEKSDMQKISVEGYETDN